MSTRKTKQRMISLPVRQLMPHPANPNRMSNTAFNKLARHIERTGQYEPIVVRRHPQKTGAYQILNGHHRVRVLKRTGHTYADCVVFKADDTQALVYLATLNQLKGRSNVQNKSRLIGRLCDCCDSKELSSLLPDSKTAIEKLNALANHQPMPGAKVNEPLLRPLTFFVTDDQQRLISDAFEKAAAGDSESKSRTQKRLQALCRIAKSYLGNDQSNYPEASAVKTGPSPGD